MQDTVNGTLRAGTDMCHSGTTRLYADIETQPRKLSGKYRISPFYRLESHRVFHKGQHASIFFLINSILSSHVCVAVTYLPP